MNPEVSNTTARAASLVVLGLALLGARPVTAAQYQDGYDDNAARALANQYSNSILHVSFTYQSNIYFGSGVRLNENFGIIAAHAVTDGIHVATVNGVIRGTSSNGILTEVSTAWVYPGFDGSMNGPDIAIIRFAQPVPGPTMAIAPAGANEVVNHFGFGNFGSPAIGMQGNDGNARAWEGRVSGSPPSLGSSTYYQATTYGYDNLGLSLNGRGANGDSGGGVFNLSGQLVGINIAQFGPTGNQFGETTFLSLSQPAVLSWIQSIITPVEPVILSLTREGADVRLVWQGKGGSNYLVQAASALGGTNTFTDLAAPLTLPGSGPVTTNYLDAGGTHTNVLTRFYRIRLN
ncbi:MAG: trypsin-like serine protease [Verrucomicrobiota bacterium]